VPEISSVSPFVVSVMLTFVYFAHAMTRTWPEGQLKVPGPGGAQQRCQDEDDHAAMCEETFHVMLLSLPVQSGT